MSEKKNPKKTAKEAKKQAVGKSTSNSIAEAEDELVTREVLEEPPLVAPEPGDDTRLNSNSEELTPFREKVVDLATQLASAKLIAESHESATAELTRSIRNLAADYLRAKLLVGQVQTGATSSQEEELPSSLRRICAGLEDVSQWLEIAPARGLNDSAYDTLFSGAMRRAQKMLQSPLLDPSTIYAEQLFDPRERISENKIFERFEEWKWPILKHREPFQDLMKAVTIWYANHLQVTIKGNLGDSAKIETEFLASLHEFCHARPKSRLCQQILSVVEGPRLASNEGKDPLEEFAHLGFRVHLIRKFFGGSDPEPREKPQRGKARFFRPWGLFRAMRIWGERDDSCEPLNEQLMTQRNLINPSLEPNPIDLDDSYQYNFGPLGVLI